MTATIKNQRIGIVGLGNMGAAIAESILRGKFELSVYDLRDEPVRELVGRGALAAASLEELAALCDVITIAVDSDEQVADVGATIVAHAQPGSTVIVNSTVRPSTIIALAEHAATKQIQVLDVAVNGGSEKASRGILTLMVGGDEATVERLRPLLKTFGRTIFYMGPTGSGVVSKLVNNVMSVGSYALQLEAMRLAAAYGLSEDAVATAVISSQGDSRGIRTWGRHDRRRAIRHAEGVTSEPMSRNLREAVVAAGLRGVSMSVTSIIADAMPTLLARRDRELTAGGPLPEHKLCDVCGQELAPPFRARGLHPECGPDYLPEA